MPKTILFFADGTWNGPGTDDDDDGVADTTNVLKLFSLLRGGDAASTIPLRDEQERQLDEGGQTVQVAKYLHGVGDSRNGLHRMLGGAFGAGVVTRIVRGYTFVSRHWERGDRIVLVGFSRGAYTVRALAALITGEGLLDRRRVDLEDRAVAYRLGSAAWQRHRRRRLDEHDRSLVPAFVDAIRDLPGFLQRDDIGNDLTAPVDVDCVAVFDTVGALGIPRYARGQRIDVYEFCDCRLGGRVRRGYHAVAIDEQRLDFVPTLWEPREGVVQLLFAGAHADVGGGYPLRDGESELSHVALGWMADRLRDEGVRLRDRPEAWSGSPLGGSHLPWTSPLYADRVGPRALGGAEARGLTLHDSVVARQAHAGPFRLYPRGELARYDPVALRTGPPAA